MRKHGLNLLLPALLAGNCWPAPSWRWPAARQPRPIRPAPTPRTPRAPPR